MSAIRAQEPTVVAGSPEGTSGFKIKRLDLRVGILRENGSADDYIVLHGSLPQQLGRISAYGRIVLWRLCVRS